MDTRAWVAATLILAAAQAIAFGAHQQHGAVQDAAPYLQILDEFETPGLETELSGIYPHPTDNDLYFVVTNGKPPYQPSMRPLLPERLRNKLLTVNRKGEVVKVLDLPDGGGLFGDLAFGDGHLWLGPLEPPALWKLDLASGKVVAKYPLPGPAGGMEFDRERNQILVQSYIGHPHIAVVDPRTGVVIRSMWSDENCQGVKKVDGDLLTVWTSSWDANAYSELWHLDESTGRPKSRTRLQGVHAAMAPLDPKVAGVDGFMSLVHVGSAVSGKTVVRRYKYISERRRSLVPPQPPRSDVFAALAAPAGSSPAARRDALLAMSADAASAGARYVVLPELGISGPLSGGPAAAVQPLAESIPGETTDAFARVAREHRAWIAVPVIERGDASGYFVSSALLDPAGEVAIVVRKRILRHDGQDGSAQPGFARILLETSDDQGRRIGLVSGDDLQAGVPRLAERGADVVLVSANWTRADPVHWDALAASLARTHNVHIVVANRDPSLSAIYSREGTTLARAPGPSSTFIAAALSTPAGQWTVRGSLGLPAVPVAVDRPFTPGLVELGRALFFDPALSSTGTVSCSTCHQPERAFSNGESTGEGVHGRRTRRNVPSILNVAFKSALHWDGNPTTLEQQAKYPLGGFDEMDLASAEALQQVLAGRPEYVRAFQRELGVGAAEIEREHVALALASFQRTLVSGGSPFDRYAYGGDRRSLSAEAIRGLAIFRGRGQCVSCHPIGRTSAIFTDGRFHRLGVGYIPEQRTYRDTGVGTVSNSNYSGMFFTPSLRNVAETAPYLHDGSAPTLEDAIRAHVMERDPAVAHPRPTLDEASIAALVAFLKSLTGAERYDDRAARLDAPRRTQ